VVGFDISTQRVQELQNKIDLTGEVDFDELNNNTIEFSSEKNSLISCNIFIVTVPTPVDRFKNPDLSPLINASQLLGSILKKGDLVIYESTVYPGATEEQCVPVLSSVSGFVLNKDFFVGYSPERINPGDKVHRLADIIKVTSGSTPEIADAVTKLYGTIITAGTHKASSIKVAEAAKVIENTQRDLNIALINELAIIFNRLNIDTEAVLRAAGTKWNFLPFRPGLVGGHCIGVDPYYLTHKAQEVGYHPEVILSGRRINDSMGKYIASVFVKSLLKANSSPLNSKVLVLGFTFKENCPDIRNTRVIDVVDGLRDFSISPEVYDPYVSEADKSSLKGIHWINEVENASYAGVIIAVAHEHFKLMGIKKIRELCKPGGLVMDIKYIFSKSEVDIRI
jgi:UDP-N-acetyl-D-glucosamine/UDP-N-acetyl-D-galactosamine dehydrogenase